MTKTTLWIEEFLCKASIERSLDYFLCEPNCIQGFKCQSIYPNVRLFVLQEIDFKVIKSLQEKMQSVCKMYCTYIDLSANGII